MSTWIEMRHDENFFSISDGEDCILIPVEIALDVATAIAGCFIDGPTGEILRFEA